MNPSFLATGMDLLPSIQADDDLQSAFLEVQRVGMALRAEAEHGQGFVFEHAQIRVFVRINFCGHDSIFMVGSEALLFENWASRSSELVVGLILQFS